MIKTKPPPRGAFDYLLDGMNDVPPERGGGGPRVRVEIEIVERRSPPAVSRGFSTFWWVVLALLLLGLAGCVAPMSPEDKAILADPRFASIAGGIHTPEARATIKWTLEQDAKQAAQNRRHADPAWQAAWRAMNDANTRQLLNYYAAHPEADPANTTIRCISSPSYDRVRTKCSNDSRTIRIEGWSN